jgi:hypothetical protein
MFWLFEKTESIIRSPKLTAKGARQILKAKEDILFSSPALIKGYKEPCNLGRFIIEIFSSTEEITFNSIAQTEQFFM